MKIVTYRELEPKDRFMLLMDQAFWWPLSPAQLERLISLDIRLKNSPVGFCAVENGNLAGYVGVMDIPTKTVSGNVETVGGIWCVATNPRFAKKGICKTLMDKAHQYFLQKKYPFSFLCTSRTIIAYAIYVRMGYVEIEKVNDYPEAYKVLGESRPERKSETELDQNKITKLYQEFVKDKTGFSVRQKNFMELLSERKKFDDKRSILTQNGYALVSGPKEVSRIMEIISPDEETYHGLLDQVESFSPNGVIDRMVTDEKLHQVYKDRGYCIEDGDHGVVMVKKLAQAEFEEEYGDSFHMGMLDMF
ncbi:MAG TPA: GNAT family N-acetyltransferase [Terriglobales bacterium]|nr:GNAT family N-acetyltransferase [Terriglobales bacterium]